MFVKGVKYFLILLALGHLIACFGKVDKRGSIKSYKNGLVTTEGGLFRVGLLPSSWKKQSWKYRAILFDHQTHDMSIGVDSFCKGAADDAPLEILNNQLFYGMTHQKDLLKKTIEMDGREAYRSRRVGEMDGVQVMMDAVVLKMNQCVFDFYYISRPAEHHLGLQAFEGFFRGFEYIKGPKLDS